VTAAASVSASASASARASASASATPATTTVATSTQIQLPLHYTTRHHTTLHYITRHPAEVGEVTTATTPKNTTPTTFWSICGFALPSVIHNNYSFPIFETSSTALCGTTGMLHILPLSFSLYLYEYIYIICHTF
jgi:hypothetical protein